MENLKKYMDNVETVTSCSYEKSTLLHSTCSLTSVIASFSTVACISGDIVSSETDALSMASSTMT